MGPGGIVTAARAADAGAALHAWGDVIGSAVDDLARGLRREIPRTLHDGLAELTPVSADAVHTAGWELRDAIAWRNDDRCIQRAVFSAMSLLQREARGDLRAAVGELATADARRGAIAVNYTPDFSSALGRARLHAAAVVRTTDGEALVIDHLFADAEDGVLTLQEWLRRTGGTLQDTRIVDPLRMPPPSPRGGPGIPAFAEPFAASQWRAFAGHLSTSWTDAAAGAATS